MRAVFAMALLQLLRVERTILGLAHPRIFRNSVAPAGANIMGHNCGY